MSPNSIGRNWANGSRDANSGGGAVLSPPTHATKRNARYVRPKGVPTCRPIQGCRSERLRTVGDDSRLSAAQRRNAKSGCSKRRFFTRPGPRRPNAKVGLLKPAKPSPDSRVKCYRGRHLCIPKDQVITTPTGYRRVHPRSNGTGYPKDSSQSRRTTTTLVKCNWETYVQSRPYASAPHLRKVNLW